MPSSASVGARKEQTRRLRLEGFVQVWESALNSPKGEFFYLTGLFLGYFPNFSQKITLFFKIIAVFLQISTINKQAQQNKSCVQFFSERGRKMNNLNQPKEQEKKLTPEEKWEQATLANNFIFYKVMRHHPDACKHLIEMLLNIKIEKMEMHSEEVIDLDHDSKVLGLMFS